MTETSESKSSLAELMARAQAGDKTAYSMIFQQITPMLRSFISRKIRSPDDTEDIVQEILVSIHKASHTFDSGRAFEVWMYTIARYRLNDFLRAHYKNVSFREQLNAESETGVMANPSVDDVTEDHDFSESITGLLDDLPDKQLTIITMMKLEGYTAKETGERLGMSETAVKVAAHRVYRKLAKKLNKEVE